MTLPTLHRRREPRRPWAAGFLISVLGAALTGCAQTPTAARPPAPNINLSGFPPEFKQGYTDGCTSSKGSRVRDEVRYRDQPQYASGWRDGFDICKRK